MDKNKKKGFTLVELIVVLAILAILAAMLVPALTGYIDKANEKKVIATARQYYVAAQTVASEAYANGDEITSISLISNKHSIIVNGEGENVLYTEEALKNNSSENKQIKYLSDFFKLAEEGDDISSFSFAVNKGQIKSAVFFTNKQIINIDDGEWTVQTYSNNS